MPTSSGSTSAWLYLTCCTMVSAIRNIDRALSSAGWLRPVTWVASPDAASTPTSQRASTRHPASSSQGSSSHEPRGQRDWAEEGDFLRDGERVGAHRQGREHIAARGPSEEIKIRDEPAVAERPEELEAARRGIVGAQPIQEQMRSVGNSASEHDPPRHDARAIPNPPVACDPACHGHGDDGKDCNESRGEHAVCACTMGVRYK